jgi:D-alanine--D-alanine ligase
MKNSRNEHLSLGFEKKNVRAKNNFIIGVICGGPSPERGISLNSARSILDHLASDNIIIKPIYVDAFKRFYEISTSQLYSNTPSDFDFKLASSAVQLAPPDIVKAFESVDLIFPVIHGIYGEDGQLQELLEANNVPFVGSDSVACKKMFYKQHAARILQENTFTTITSALLVKGSSHNINVIIDFFIKNNLNRVVIKPVAGGSSIGVFSAATIDDAVAKMHKLFAMNIGDVAIIEPFCEGTEFTVIVLENNKKEPVALVPSEIKTSYSDGQIFDYRKKYLPTQNTTWLCPPSFSDSVIKNIQEQAQAIFKLFFMRDFARLDGWILNNGKIVFSDLNPISGMEQNSFIFQQASRIGITHQELLWNIVNNACNRYGLKLPQYNRPTQHASKIVKVLFGGNNVERQVSLMSGTNVWLKLRKSAFYRSEPFFLDLENNIWRLPYTYALNHTVEEVYNNCSQAKENKARLEEFVKEILANLAYHINNVEDVDFFAKKLSWQEFLAECKTDDAFVFLALHGGDGENGVIQSLLEENNIMFNGSCADASKVCMDKYAACMNIKKLADENINFVKKRCINLGDYAESSLVGFQQLWQKLTSELETDDLIIKPRSEGCSAGILRIHNADELERFFTLVNKGDTFIAHNSFSYQDNIIEIPKSQNKEYLVEEFIKTDKIVIENNDLIYNKNTGWLELTVGIIEKNNNYQSLNPSITIASGVTLSLEEKFQSGTGINITPPPENIVTVAQKQLIKNAIEKIARELKIKNYARIDIFFNTNTNTILLIEPNTLPGLTPSTVIYHQALAEEPALSPIKFLETIISNKINACDPIENPTS